MAMSLARHVYSFSRKIVSFARRDVRNLSSLAPGPGRSSSVLGVSAKPCEKVAVNSSLMSVRTTYAGLHTEGDRRFVELLKEEIEEEKKRSMPLPQMSDGWKVSFNGALGSLTKTHEGDKIEVSFTLNGSIPPIDDEVEDMDNEENEAMVSYPEFNVKVTKSGNPKVAEFECYFPDDVQEGVADESMGMFSVRNVVVYEGEVAEDTYIIETENLDPDVYSYFISYLADRSIDQQFAEEFIQLTTAAEQSEYIRSLKKLKDFIASK